MRVKLINGWWTLRFVPMKKGAHGYCDRPDTPDRGIYVNSRLRGKRKREIVIHEILHAVDWHKSEEWVEQVAYDLNRVLSRLEDG